VKLLLNDKPYLHPATLETWGQWLAVLDRDSSRAGRIVTAVRFDGVDEPAFRAARALGRRLDEASVVEVDTGSRQLLLRDTAQQGATMVTSLAASAASVGEAYRSVDLSDAHAMLPQLIDGVRSIVTLTDECAAALGTPRPAIVCHGVPFDSWMDEFGRRLAVLLDAQAHEDWLTVADCLEYEIAPALRDWGGAFEQLASIAAST
jgi:hypothetical protein